MHILEFYFYILPIKDIIKNAVINMHMEGFTYKYACDSHG